MRPILTDQNTMNTAIIAPKNSLAKIDKMVPKPTKTEIINAMVERARVKHELDEKSRRIQADALKGKIIKLADKLRKTAAFREPSINSYSSNPHVEYEVRVSSPELTELMKQWDEVRRGRAFDPKQAKEAIRAKLNNEPARVNLLNDPEAVKAIDAKLEEWSM